MSPNTRPPLSPDDLLSTTRSVRKRLDFSRPVEPEIVRACLELALQAPTGGNRQGWQWVVITDAEKRKAIGELYRRSFQQYLQAPINSPEALEKLRQSNESRAETLVRVRQSSDYLSDHMHEAPVMVIPCIVGRPEGMAAAEQAGFWGSILPAAWSFMLALRSYGLGSAWTSLHIVYEREAADILGIPYAKVTQTALLPVAYTIGTDFKPAQRESLDTVLHWDQW